MGASHPTLALFLLFFSTIYFLCQSFSPVDNYLIDCGSDSDSTVDNRLFTSDSPNSNSRLFSSARTTSIRVPSPIQDLPPIYNAARVFNAPSKYEFHVKDPGTHMIRLHFHQLGSEIDFSNSQFHVLIDEFVVLHNFSGVHSENPRVLEYLIWVSNRNLQIRFLPAMKSKFAFVNAIEVISAPKDLILDTAQFLNNDKVESFNGLTKQALEVVYRINVGGPKITPFNDSLWRNWVSDDDYLKSSDGWDKSFFSGRISYQLGGASREVGPDNMYNTARLIRSKNASVPKVNLTWEFPVSEGYKYLIRFHFCDIASLTLGMLYFNVYVNTHLAYENLDLSKATSYTLASPFYADFVFDAVHSGTLSLGIGPSENSVGNAVDGILNGVEIMKMSNSMGSLDGKVSAGSMIRCWPRGNASFMAPLIAVVCLVLILSMVLHRRMTNSMEWIKLPMEASDVNPKNSRVQLSGKF